MFHLLVSSNGWADVRDSMPIARIFENTEHRLAKQFKPDGILDLARLSTLPALFMSETPGIAVLAFQTRDDLSPIGLPDHVAVYFPQSYNFAGNVFIVPKSRVEPIDVDSTTVMTFIVSGGVSGELERPAATPA